MAGLEKKANYMSMGVPSTSMFFKIFRACLGCEKIEQLWVYEINQHGYLPIDESQLEEIAASYQQEKQDNKKEWGDLSWSFNKYILNYFIRKHPLNRQLILFLQQTYISLNLRFF